MNAFNDLAVSAAGDLLQASGSCRGWDFLGSVPVPLRQRVHDGLTDLLGNRNDLKCCMPMGQGGPGPIERLRFVRALDDFPGMLVSAGYGNVFNRSFHRRLVETGAFTSCQPERTASVFREAGLVDPAGWIGTFAAAPFVLLADKRRLGHLPIPRRWADLLEPEYRGQVVFGGWRPPGPGPFRQINLFFLLCMAQAHGIAGVRRLLANVPTLMHSTQMPRVAGGGASTGGLYVLPWSLAEMCPRREETQVVWPEEGALAYPLWLTVRKDRRQRLDVLVRHFHGPVLADVLKRNRYPALCPECEPDLPRNARLSWPGWDFVRHPSTAGLLKTIRRLAAQSLESV